MSTSPVKPFEELAIEWAPRAKRFLTLLVDQVTLRVKQRLPRLLTGSALLIVAVFCIGAVGAWLSAAGWHALQTLGFSAAEAALIVGGGFFALGILCYFVGKRSALGPSRAPVEVLEPENGEIEVAGQELITLFKDLTIAAKHSLSPNEVLKPHAVKMAVASTALGLLVALNLNSRKERIK